MRIIYAWPVKRYITKSALAHNHRKTSLDNKDIQEDRFLAQERVTVGNRSSLQLARNIIVLNICSFPGLADNAFKVASSKQGLKILVEKFNSL